jgi:hypothetical protein
MSMSGLESWLGLLAWRLMRIADGNTVSSGADLTPSMQG